METNEMCSIFCRNLKLLRAQLNYSVTKMSKILQISTKSLRLIESGTLPKCVKYTVLLEIHKEFNITPSEMVSNNFNHKTKAAD